MKFVDVDVHAGLMVLKNIYSKHETSIAYNSSFSPLN